MEEINQVAFNPLGELFAVESFKVRRYRFLNQRFRLYTIQYVQERVKLMAVNNDYMVYVGGTGVVRYFKPDSSEVAVEKFISTVQNPISLQVTKNYLVIQLVDEFKVCTFEADRVFDDELNEYHHGTFTLHERIERPFVTFQEVGDKKKLCLMGKMADDGIEKHTLILQHDCKTVSASSCENTLALSTVDGCKIYVYRNEVLAATLSKSQTQSVIYDMAFAGNAEYLVVSSSSSTIHIFSLTQKESLLGNIAEYAVGRKSIATCKLPADVGATKCYLHVISGNRFYVVVAGQKKFMLYMRDDLNKTACKLLLESEYNHNTPMCQ